MGLGSIVGSVIGAGASLLGGKRSRDTSSSINDQNAKLQREFAQQGIRWKVADAQAAGIHPLYALGSPGASYTPSAVVGDNGLAQAGQHIGRAVEAGLSTGERDAREIADLQKDKLRAEIGLLRSEAHRNAAQVGPPINLLSNSNSALPGQEAAGYNRGTELRLNEVVPYQSGKPFAQTGSNPDISYNVTANGISMVPGTHSGVQDQELTNPAFMQWNYRNFIKPMIDAGLYKSLRPPRALWQKHFPGAYDVRLSPLEGVWKPVYAKSSRRPVNRLPDGRTGFSTAIPK